jgi:hypothetical protein
VVVPGGSYLLDVFPTTGSTKAVLAPVRVTLTPGTLTRVFAYGDPDKNVTPDGIVQVLKVPVVGAGAPKSVHTGDGGQAATEFVTSSSRTWGLVGAGVVGLLLAGLFGTRSGSVRGAQLVRSRPRP